MRQENQTVNIPGRLFDAFTNKTLTTDYSLTVFEGFGGQLVGKPAFEKLDYYGSALLDYYTGFYELQELNQGYYVTIAEAKGFPANFMRFYSHQNILKPQSFPMVPDLGEG